MHKPYAVLPAFTDRPNCFPIGEPMDDAGAHTIVAEAYSAARAAEIVAALNAGGTLTVAEALACILQAIENCERSGNTEWRIRHADSIVRIVRDRMPSGSGVDTGTTLDESSKPDRFVFNLSFHHMDEHGSYDGWTDHSVIVTPTFCGPNVRVTGRDRNGVKDYLADLYREALAARIPV